MYAPIVLYVAVFISFFKGGTIIGGRDCWLLPPGKRKKNGPGNIRAKLMMSRDRQISF